MDTFLFELFVFIPIGFIFGRYAEKKHIRNLGEREKACSGFSVTDIKSFPAIATDSITPKLFTAEVTIASDYYKRFAGGIKGIFGGEIKSYASLMQRARREAVLRLIEQAKSEGYNAICNIRLDSADIGGTSTTKHGSIMVSVIGSGTAYQANAN